MNKGKRNFKALIRWKKRDKGFRGKSIIKLVKEKGYL